jgi:hypothetical protein
MFWTHDGFGLQGRRNRHNVRKIGLEAKQQTSPVAVVNPIDRASQMSDGNIIHFPKLIKSWRLVVVVVINQRLGLLKDSSTASSPAQTVTFGKSTLIPSEGAISCTVHRILWRSGLLPTSHPLPVLAMHTLASSSETQDDFPWENTEDG